MRHVTVIALCSSLLLVASGCGNRLVKIKGVVTLDGKPVAGAQVQFIPTNDAGREAMGQTNDSGSYTLTTFASGDGVQRGDYKVLVSKLSERALRAPDPNDKAAMEKFMFEGMKKSREGKRDDTRPGETLPGVYADSERTPLIMTVPAPDGKYDLDLYSALATPARPGMGSGQSPRR